MKHLPECPNYEGPCCPWMGDCDCQCICDILYSCRERTIEEAYQAILALDEYNRDISMDHALDTIKSLSPAENRDKTKHVP